MNELSIVSRSLSVVCFAVLCGCSVLVGVDGKQCDTNAECVTAKLGTSCVSHVCVAAAASCSGADCNKSCNEQGFPLVASAPSCRVLEPVSGRGSGEPLGPGNRTPGRIAALPAA
jgi:hypothetical protein